MKKLKKELNKLLPEGLECKNDLKPVLESTNPKQNRFALWFSVEEKEKQPEWITIKKDSEGLTKNMLYQIKKWVGDKYGVINDNNEFSYPISLPHKFSTPAEIEAHKLGFHVGDEVDLKMLVKNGHSSFPGIIDEFYYQGNELYANLKGMAGCRVSHITFSTKNPPKQPILQKDGKYFFYGDKYWWIDKSDNWKLETDFIKDCHSKKIYWKDNDILARFTTKEKALKYVLDEAYRVFDGYHYVYLDKEKVEKNIIGEFSIRKIIANGTDFGILDRKGIWLWCEASGWLATPIKKNLMLGEYEVTIENGVIKAKDGHVTKQEWNDWYQKFKIINAHCSYFTIELGVYTVKSTSNHISIGCIGLDDEDSVTLDQIEAINKAVNEL